MTGGSAGMPGSAGGALPGTALRRRQGATRFVVVLVVLSALLVCTVTIAVMIGPVRIPPLRIWHVIGHHLLPSFVSLGDATPAQADIVWNLRLPRVLLGAAVGAGLAVVGAAMQALVRNPLADPYVFGITAGASVGATAVIVLGVATFGAYSLSVAAFLGSLAALVLVLLLAGWGGGLSPARLILAGVAVMYVMSAVSSGLLYFAATQEGDAGAAQQVLFWLLGGLAAAEWSQITLPVVAVLGGTVVLLLQARSLNALLVGDETAATLGVPIGVFRAQLFVLTALMTGVMVAVSGGIGFVGLMVPHAVRMMVGADHRRLLPVCVLAGATFLVGADIVARMAADPQEIPIGIVTALVGAPFFAVILRARRRSAPGVGA